MVVRFTTGATSLVTVIDDDDDDNEVTAASRSPCSKARPLLMARTRFASAIFFTFWAYFTSARFSSSSFFCHANFAATRMASRERISVCFTSSCSSQSALIASEARFSAFSIALPLLIARTRLASATALTAREYSVIACVTRKSVVRVCQRMWDMLSERVL